MDLTKRSRGNDMESSGMGKGLLTPSPRHDNLNPQRVNSLLDSYEIEMICRQLDQFILSCSHPHEGQEAGNHSREVNSIVAYMRSAGTHDDLPSRPHKVSSSSSEVSGDKGRRPKKKQKGFWSRHRYGGLLGCGTGGGHAQVVKSIEAFKDSNPNQLNMPQVLPINKISPFPAVNGRYLG